MNRCTWGWPAVVVNLPTRLIAEQVRGPHGGRQSLPFFSKENSETSVAALGRRLPYPGPDRQIWRAATAYQRRLSHHPAEQESQQHVRGNGVPATIGKGHHAVFVDRRPRHRQCALCRHGSQTLSP
jgi:hypothetical protein